MSGNQNQPCATPLLSAQLQHNTSTQHACLDERLLAASPFADRDRFARFLRLQLRLHFVTLPYCSDPEIQGLLPSLVDADPLTEILAAYRDVGISEKALAEDIVAARAASCQEKLAAIGWIYVQEEACVRAAMLFRASERPTAAPGECYVRYLSDQHERRNRCWQQLTEDLDALPLNDALRVQVLRGARAALYFVYQSLDALYAVGTVPGGERRRS